jgi:hypothetical protein
MTSSTAKQGRRSQRGRGSYYPPSPHSPTSTKPCISARRFVPSCTLAIIVPDYGHNANSGLARQTFFGESGFVQGFSGGKVHAALHEGIDIQGKMVRGRI